MTEDTLDLNEVLERIQNDRELLLELLDIFLNDYPAKIVILKSAVEKKDFTELKSISHAFKGATASLSAKKLNRSFLKIEQMARDSNLDGIGGTLKEIDGQMEDLRAYAAKLKEDFKKAQ